MVITREHGVIPGCIAAGSNTGMMHRDWRFVETGDQYCARLQAELRQMRIMRGANH